MEKVKQMNNRVSEAEKKRGQMEGYDISKTEAKLQSAEERKAALLKETQDRASAEVAKVCALNDHESVKFILHSAVSQRVVLLLVVSLCFNDSLCFK